MRFMLIVFSIATLCSAAYSDDAPCWIANGGHRQSFGDDKFKVYCNNELLMESSGGLSRKEAEYLANQYNEKYYRSQNNPIKEPDSMGVAQ